MIYFGLCFSVFYWWDHGIKLSEDFTISLYYYSKFLHVDCFISKYVLILSISVGIYFKIWVKYDHSDFIRDFDFSCSENVISTNVMKLLIKISVVLEFTNFDIFYCLNYKL